MMMMMQKMKNPSKGGLHATAPSLTCCGVAGGQF